MLCTLTQLYYHVYMTVFGFTLVELSQSIIFRVYRCTAIFRPDVQEVANDTPFLFTMHVFLRCKERADGPRGASSYHTRL